MARTVPRALRRAAAPEVDDGETLRDHLGLVRPAGRAAIRPPAHA
jgi:hypothetical protein